MTGAPLPSSAAQALVPLDRGSELRARKHDLDELDDDDTALIGRVFSWATPRHWISVAGVVVGITAGVALSPLTVVGAAAVLIGLPAIAVVSGRRDLRATLIDHNLAPSLVDELFAGATMTTTVRASLSLSLWRRALPRDEDYASYGRVVIAAARSRPR